MFEVRAKEEEVLICLQQEDRRMWRKNGKGENLPIGFEVLKVSRATEQPQAFWVIKKKYFTPSSSSAGGGEPLQSGAVRGRAGGQLHLHGFPECDTEGNSDSGTLCCAAHHLPTGRHWTLPASALLPLSYQTQVKCWSGKKG